MINGIDFHLIETIVQYLNFSYELIEPIGQWGNKMNGSWNGLIGKVIDGSADMALGGLTADTDREKVVDFTIPYFYSDLTFFMASTEFKSININLLLVQPFDKNVWISLFCSVIFSLILMMIMKQKYCQIFKIIIRTLLHQGLYYMLMCFTFYNFYTQIVTEYNKLLII